MKLSLISFVITWVLVAPSFAEAPHAPAAGHPTAPDTFSCNLSDELARELVLDKTRQAALQLHFANAALESTFKGKDILAPLETLNRKYVGFFRNIIGGVDAYEGSLGNSSYAYSATGLGGFAAAAGIALSAKAPLKNAAITGALGGTIALLSVHSMRGLWGSLSRQCDKGELPIGEKKAVLMELEKSTGEMSTMLSDLLGWTPQQKKVFERALGNAYTDSVVIQTRQVRRGGETSTVADHLTATPVDISVLLKTHGLASPEEIETLKALSAQYDSMSALDANRKEPEIKAALAKQENLNASIRMVIDYYQMLGQMRARLQPSDPLFVRLEGTSLKVKEILHTIQLLCDVGLLTAP